MEECIHSKVARERGIDNTPSPEIEAHITESVESLLDPLREAWEACSRKQGWGTPAIRISSGYRCRELNRAVSANDNVKLYSEYTMKTGNLICLLLSLAIVGHVVYALLSESEPPRLVSQGKSYTVKELNNEGYNPEICFSGDFSLSL